MFRRDHRRHAPRNSGAHTAPTAPDRMFPHLPRHRADFLRDQTIRLLHEEGFTTTWLPDGRIRARGTTTLTVDLHTLSLQLADAGAHANLSELLELIRRHVRDVTEQDDAGVEGAVGAVGTVGASGASSASTLTDAEFLRRLRVRLAPRDILDALDGPVVDASRDFAGDLCTSLVLDGPDAVTVLDDDALAAHGSETSEELGDLYRVGYRNTWQDLTECHVSTTPIQEFVRGAVKGTIHQAETAARFWSVESDSFFLASAPLFLDELLPHWLPGLDMTHGVLVAVPHRHLLLVREVSTGQDLLDGIKVMSTEALTQHRSNPGPLSARLHLWHEGETTAFTEVSTNAEGQQVVTIQPDAYLASRIES
ncbi:hypothetical protein ACT3SZ_10310 [Corynebacterium sp. AOP40-9SA-29]|uniref:hypothetical protein n=1 Tax=Corynebacterium sp. AOP40-9SA-29 TaxID=3457677 RepID=UPI00403485B5